MNEIWTYLSLTIFSLTLVLPGVLLAAWRALPLILIALALDFGLRRRLAAGHLVLLWMVVAVRLLLPISFASEWSLQVPLDRALLAMFAGRETPAPDVAIGTSDIALRAAANPDLSTHSPDPTPAPTGWPEQVLHTVLQLAVFSYGLVAAALLLRSLTAHRRFAYRLRNCQPVEDAPFVDLMLRECAALRVARRPLVKIVPELATPAVFGLFRPTICLPMNARETLTEQELRWVLRHELAHVRRRDAWVLAVVSLMRCLHWLNPLAWLVAARVRTHLENAADDLAMGQSSAPDAVAYGRLLLRLAEEVSPARASAALGFLQFVTGRRLRQRIEHATRQRGPQRRWLAGAFTAALLGLAFVGWTDAADEQRPKKPNLPREYFSHVELTIGESTPVDKGTTSLQTYAVRDVLQRIREVDPGENPELMLTSLSQWIAPGHEFQIQDDRLLAEVTPPQHQQLKQLLEVWRRGGPQQIVIEFRMISSHQKFASHIDWLGKDRVTDLELSGPQPAFAAKASHEQMRRFIAGQQGDAQSNILFAPKVTLFNGQAATILTGTKRPFVTAVEPSEGALKPIIQVLNEGLKAMVQPITSGDDVVTLTLDVKVSKIGEVALANLPYGPHDGKTGTTVQVPNSSTNSVRGTVQLTPGESLVIAMPELYNEKQPAGAERAVYYAITPRVLDLRDP